MTDFKVHFPTKFDITNALNSTVPGDLIVLPIGTPESMVYWVTDLIERTKPGVLIRLEKPTGNFDDGWARALHDELERNGPGDWGLREEGISGMTEEEYRKYTEQRGGPTGA